MKLEILLNEGEKVSLLVIIDVIWKFQFCSMKNEKEKGPRPRPRPP